MGLFKSIFMPTGEKRSVVGLRSWTVKWKSYRFDSWSEYARKKEEAEVFTSIEDARAFKTQLEENFAFTKSTFDSININENKQ